MAQQESAYIVSSLKYRPQTFEDVVGQEHVSRTLKNALLRKRLANGYIFTGPRGVGKTTSARILAKAINCENSTDGNPCNTCKHCVEITAGRSIDVLEVDGASTRGIDAIRELREVVKYPPTHSNYRVYIIDEVHMLTKEAFNALLKTLEEPPPQVLFIFATTEPQKVPLTILSRCQRYDFRMIATETMVARLRMISKNEGIPVSEEGLALIARKAAGSLRDALSLLDQVSAFAEGEASVELVRRVLGVLDVTIYFDLVHHIASQSAENVLTQVNGLISRGISISEFLVGLHDHFRALLVVKVAGITDFLDVSEADAQALMDQAVFFEERDLLRMQSIVTETIKEQRFVSNQLVSVELMLLKLVRMTRALDLDALLSGKDLPTRTIPAPKPVVLPEQALEPPKTQTPAAEPIASTKAADKTPPAVDAINLPAAEPQDIPDEPEFPMEDDAAAAVTDSAKGEDDPESVEMEVISNDAGDDSFSLEDITRKWDEFIDNLSSVGRSAGAFMSEGHPAKYAQGVLSVYFAKEHKYHVETLNKNMAAISDVATRVFGNKFTFKLLEQNGHKPKQRKEDEILAHPNSQHLLDIFDGEIIDD